MCADHAVAALVIARAADTITVGNKTDYYANADCTGAIVGTVTQSADATATCIKDEGTYPAQNGVSGGLALQGNTLYDLTANGSSWVVDGVFTKK